MTDTTSLPDPDPADEPTADTAGEVSHENPDDFRGDDADAPEDTGKPPQVD